MSNTAYNDLHVINHSARSFLAAKYSSCPASLRLTSGLPHGIQTLMQAAFSQSTWRKHEAALNCFKLFETSLLLSSPWPLSHTVLCSFTVWVCTEKKLKSSTISSYLSSLKTIHSLRNLDCSAFDNFTLKSLIRGKENQEIYSTEGNSSRRVMTLPLLKLLGHEIAISNWGENSKQTVWAAFTLAFFGSFRMGEILPQQEKNFSPKDTLLWGDLNFLDKNHILIHIKSPKSRLPQGEFVDIFSFTGHGVCPVAALVALKDSQHSIIPTSPVFCFQNFTNLTKTTVNSILPQLLLPHLGSESNNFSGHSFRAGIPAILACHPEEANSSDIMGWGRWKSEAYQCYTRLKLDQKRGAFQKISNLLNL